MIFPGLNALVKTLFIIKFFTKRNYGTETEDAWPALTPDSDRQNNGRIINLSPTLQAYYVSPKNVDSNKAVFVHHDANGWTGGRIRSISDQIADKGYHVFLVNFFDTDNGVAAYGGFGSGSLEAFQWFRQWTPEVIIADIKTAMAYVDENFNQIDSIGTIGFCFGGWVGLHHASLKFPKLKATASCHPSYQVEDNFGGLDNLVSQVETPMLICPAGSDSDDFKKGGMIEKNFNARGIPIEITEFPDQRHGWVPRGDTSDPKVEEGVKEAIKTYMNFFERYL